MKGTQRKKIICITILLLCCLMVPGCGGDSGGSEEGGKKGDFKIPEFKGVVFDEGKSEGKEGILLDLSHTSDGYIALKNGASGKFKLQVIKGKEQYLYDIQDGKEQFFPLQCGNGTYKISVMKNLEGTKYYEVYGTSAKVKLSDEFAPYVRPNQYAAYNESSNCVKQAEKIAKSSTDEKDYIEQVYKYISEKVKYDKAKAKSIKKGYIPDPDKVLADGQGICFDYACLAASMLRSMGIPTRIIFGYVAPDDLYHAWNMFYTEEDGWSAVEFEVNPNDWSRIDLTFYANGEDEEFIGDGSNYTEVYKY